MNKILIILLLWGAGCTQQKEIKPITEFNGLDMSIMDSITPNEIRLLTNVNLNRTHAHIDTFRFNSANHCADVRTFRWHGNTLYWGEDTTWNWVICPHDSLSQEDYFELWTDCMKDSGGVAPSADTNLMGSYKYSLVPDYQVALDSMVGAINNLAVSLGKTLDTIRVPIHTAPPCLYSTEYDVCLKWGHVPDGRAWTCNLLKNSLHCLRCGVCYKMMGEGKAVLLSEPRIPFLRP